MLFPPEVRAGRGLPGRTANRREVGARRSDHLSGACLSSLRRTSSYLRLISGTQETILAQVRPNNPLGSEIYRRDANRLLAMR